MEESSNKKCNNKSDPSANNGLITKIWGPPSWESFHSIGFGYPMEPTEEEKKDYFEYFRLYGKVLPCIFCRQSYQKFILEEPTLLDMKVMKSRETLTKWQHRLHDAVNKKLGVDYGTTYLEMCDKFESYRAKCTKTSKGCLMPLNMKMESYVKADEHRAPIIDPKYAYVLVHHAELHGINKYKEYLDYYANLERNSEAWKNRDVAARKIIKYMRKHGVEALDNGLPTIYEMLLICMLSTTLEISQLETIYHMIDKQT